MDFPTNTMPNMKPASVGGMMPGQAAANPTMAGQTANMVKALMEGNDQFKQAQAMKQMAMQRAAQQGSGVVPPGAGMGVAPPVNPQGMQGGQPIAPAMMGAPPNMGAPVQPDPMTQALFSPIPGAGG